MEKIARQNAVLNRRIKASFFDAGCFVVLYFILNLIISLIITRNGSNYTNAYNEITTNIEYSNLCKIDAEKGYLKYEVDELIDKSGDTSNFVNITTYFYLNYLSGNNLKSGYESSKEKVDYSIKWYNENILEIGKNNYFVVASNNPDSISLEIGKTNNEYITINGDASYKTFINNKYNEAITYFYNIDYIRNDSKIMSTYNSVNMIVSMISSLLIIYFLVPCIYKSKQTFGKRIFKLLIVKNDILVNPSVIILRLLPAALVCVFISFVGEVYWELALPIIAILISSGLMIFTKSNSALHDYVAGTSVISLEKYLEQNDENK